MINSISQTNSPLGTEKRQLTDNLPQSDTEKTGEGHAVGAQTAEPSTHADSLLKPSHAILNDEVTSLSTDNLKQAINEQADIDVDKVTVIKDAISRGEYPLDTKQIAQALLSLESLLN